MRHWVNHKKYSLVKNINLSYDGFLFEDKNMNWLDKLFENPYKAEMRKKIKSEFKNTLPLSQSQWIGDNFWVGRSESDNLSIFGVYYHIVTKRKYQLLDFSNTVDGVCYVQDIESLEVIRCVRQQLKPISR